MIVLLGCVWCIMMSCTHEPITENSDCDPAVHEWEDSTINGDALMSSRRMLFSVGDTMMVERSETTRATTNNGGTCTFSTGDLVAVAVTRSGASEDVRLYRVKSDGSLEYAGSDNNPFVWHSQSETVSIRAWSYGTTTNLDYTLTPPETRDYTLETNQNSNGYRELLYCKAADKSFSGGSISLTFYHQLSRVVFNVTHELSGTLSVSSIRVGNTTSFPVSASFAVPTGSSNVGTWTTKNTYSKITPKSETTQSGFQRTHSAVVFPKNYAKNTILYTLTNSKGSYVYMVSETGGVTLTAGNQYNYTITVKDKTYKMNPLFYMSQSNISNSAGTALATAQDAGYYFTFNDALSTFTGGSNYTAYTLGNITLTGGVSTEESTYKFHLPSVYELLSIFPATSTLSQTIWSYSGAQSRAKVSFGYNSTTKAGIADNSYWVKADTYEMHAIRFLGTDYCSAWKYIWNGSMLTIYATLIPQIANAEAAATWYTANWSTVYFGTNSDIYAFTRHVYGRGGRNTGKGSGTEATEGHGKFVRLWTASVEDASNSWSLRVSNSDFALFPYNRDPSPAYVIRLFRDN